MKTYPSTEGKKRRKLSWRGCFISSILQDNPQPSYRHPYHSLSFIPTHPISSFFPLLSLFTFDLTAPPQILRSQDIRMKKENVLSATLKEY